MTSLTKSSSCRRFVKRRVSHYSVRWTQREVTMAKPNYSFEKRQRELKKAKEKEEKRLKKLADKAAGIHSGADGESEGESDGEPSEQAGTPAS